MVDTMGQKKAKMALSVLIYNEQKFSALNLLLFAKFVAVISIKVV